MKAENVILGLLAVTVVGGIGFTIYKKTKTTKELANKDKSPGSTSNAITQTQTTHSADGMSGLKNSQTRHNDFNPKSSTAKIRYVKDGILWESTKDGRSKRAIKEV